MTEVVFLTGDYCSGSTLMFTLFRNTGEFYCLYEPLHGRILQYRHWPLRPYEHHFHVESYFDELRGFRRIPELFSPEWSVSALFLEPEDEEPRLRRYLDYLIEEAGSRSDRVVIKENRMAFRLGWLRHNYPEARIVHIQRDRERQWASVLRRVQSHFKRQDVGQEDPGFNGFTIAQWCDDLAPHFPELAAEHSQSGYERFCKLWARSREYGRQYPDLTVSFERLTSDFDEVWGQIAACVGSNCPASSIAHLVVPPERSQSDAGVRPSPALDRLIQRAGNRYAEIRAAMDTTWRRYSASRS